MSNRIKRFLLCLLAVSTMTVTGNIYAEGEEETTAAETSEETEESESGENADTETKAKRSESVEKADFSVEDVKTYLKKIGTSEGLDYYFKKDKIEDAIWEENGGKPEKKSDYTDEQKALADKIDDIKKLGTIVAVDSSAGTAVASFKSDSKCDEGKLFVSDGGRYIVITDEDKTKVIGSKQIISSLDDPNVFISDGGKTIDLMDKTNKKVEETFTYSSDDDGMRVYKSASSDKFAWVADDMSVFYGIYRYGAENDSFRMIVDDRNANFGIENKETGYTWWASPFGATRDPLANQLLNDGVRSTNTMNFGIPEKRNNQNSLYSHTDDCTTSVSDITNGIRITYNYSSAGFSFPVDYTLEGDHMKASLKVSEIKETNSANVATEITVLGSFGAASDKEEGYFVIPDGSGALVRFNNNRTTQSNAYRQAVYGSDVTVVPTTKGAVTEQIYLPVYGIVKDDNAMMVVASKGDSNAVLSAQVSKQSNTSYNLCNFTFTLRNTDTYYMSGNSNQEFTVFESGKIKSDDIELLYYPISKEGADYTDIAECYRNYLVNEKGVTAKTTENEAAAYIDLYGGVLKKKPILGIPITMKSAVTTYSQAEDILTKLKSSGVDDMVISYKNWTNDGIKNKVDTDAKASGKLGGKKDFKSLTSLIDSSGWELYPVSDDRDFYSGNGYFSFTDTAVRVSGAYSRIVSYDRAYGIPDGFKKNMSLLSPSCFGEVFSDLGKGYSKAGLDGVSLDTMTTSLYGDYGKKTISRYDSMKLLTENYAKLDGSLEKGILADCANAYALPYVSNISGVPLTSSRFDLFDEDIPFYQMVVHGLIPYSTTAVNGDADPEQLLLMAAATGSNLSYDLLYSEVSDLKDTEFDVYYYANYEHWIETIGSEYQLLKPILSSTSTASITDYETENEGKLVTTTYSNGDVVKVDFEAKTIDFNGEHYDLAEYAQEGGIRF